VAHAKPDPDLFLAAAALLGVEPRHAFVVGDSVWDLLAARRAGALGIGVLSGGYGREELERVGAYRVYADPADLLAPPPAARARRPARPRRRGRRPRPGPATVMGRGEEPRARHGDRDRGLVRAGGRAGGPGRPDRDPPCPAAAARRVAGLGGGAAAA